jgi:hypothetical protein
MTELEKAQAVEDALTNPRGYWPSGREPYPSETVGIRQNCGERGETSNCYVCCLEKDHNGDHIAFAYYRDGVFRVLERWSRSS